MSGRASGPLSPRGSARQRLQPAPAYPPALTAEWADDDLGDQTLYLAWQVAEWADQGADRPALLTLFARTLAAVARGSTRLPVDAAARAVLAAAPAVVGAPGDRRPFILDGHFLYAQRLLASEDRLVAALTARARRPSLFPGEALDAAVAGDAVSTDEQRAAVRAALGRRLAVITGGPGTGKTTVVLALVRALVRVGVAPEAIALAAPTGKAANRLDETVRGENPGLPAAQTLHRLLGYAPRAGAFLRGHHHRLPQRAVIVDEGSMIDLALMERLAAAVADDALLVILGDADQLPSVEAGAVFRDLAAEPTAVPVLRLTRSFRMDPARGEGRRILDLARALRGGEPGGLTPRDAASDLAFAGTELVPAVEREALLERWYDQRIAGAPGAEDVHPLGENGFAPADEERLAALHRHFQSFRLLCLTRGRPTGVESCNAWLQRRHGDRRTAGSLSVGAPVIVLRNDYDRGLFNGDQGLVVLVREGDREPRPMAVFPVGARWSAFDLDSLRDTIEPAFAMTVHKAQGSEYDDVVLLLPQTPIALLSRELLYTALTRSRRSVVVCGSAEVLAAGAARPLTRSSGVADKLRAAR